MITKRSLIAGTEFDKNPKESLQGLLQEANKTKEYILANIKDNNDDYKSTQDEIQKLEIKLYNLDKVKQKFEAFEHTSPNEESYKDSMLSTLNIAINDTKNSIKSVKDVGKVFKDKEKKYNEELTKVAVSIEVLNAIINQD